jgi:DNA primase
MTLLDLLPELKRMATTHGGEWAGPCPFCGGRDRFRVWPNEGTTGRYWCRGCGKHGDGIQLLRDRDGLSFPEALKAWGLPSTAGHRTERNNCSTGATWEPRPVTTPGATWRERAGAFLGACQRTLAGPSGAKCRAFLIGRGLKSETIERAGLGWNMADRYEAREAWGLPEEINEDIGKPRRILIPRGLIIPLVMGGRVIRLRVRRSNPKEDEDPYHIVKGSAMVPLSLGCGRAWVIVESELDAFLLRQESGDLAGVIALGSNTTRPDAETDQALREAGLILVSLDSDGAGAREAWGFWKRTYPNSRRWPIPAGLGKDPTEAKQAGLDLRSWILAGLPGLIEETERPGPFHEAEHTAAAHSTIEPEQKPTTAPLQGKATARLEPLQSTQIKKTYKDQGEERRMEFKPFPANWKTRFNEEQLERLAIMTVDGGLTDLEAFAEVISQC